MIFRYLFVTFSIFYLFACGKSDGIAPSSSLGPSSLAISPATPTLAVNNQITFTASGGVGSYSYSIFSGSGSILSVTGNYTAPAAAGTAVVRVIDSLGQFADAVITINSALQIAPANQSVAVNGTINFTANGGVSPLTFGIVSGAGSIDATTGVFTAPSTSSTTVVRVTDSLGNSSDANIGVFESLGITPSSATISINSTVTFSAAAGSGPYTYSIVSGGGSINAGTGEYTAPASPDNIVVRVTDSLSQTADANLTVVNQAPVISDIADQSDSEDTIVQINFTVSDVDSVLGCATSVSASSSNTVLLPVANIAFSGTAPNCTAMLTPDLNQNGSSTVTFSLTDGLNTVQDSFIYTVAGANDAPVMSNITTQSTNEDTQLVINFTVSDVDNPLDCTTSITSSSSNASLIDATEIVFGGTAPNCTATIDPELNQNGSVNLTFRVTDSGGLFADRTFQVDVNTVNDAPTISDITDRSLKTDSSIVVNYSVNDVDSALDCSSLITVSSSQVSVLPDSDIAKGGTSPNCTLTITPSLNVDGASTVTVQVSDGASTATDTFDITLTRVTSLVASPASFGLAVSATQQVTGTAFYSDSSSAVVTSSSLASWSSSNVPVAAVDNSSSKGLVTGVSAGSANISFSYKGLTSNSSSGSVLSVTSVSVSKGAVSSGVGSQAFIAATAQDSSSTFDITSSGVWSSDNTSVATVSNGVISFVAAGSAVVTVSYAGLSANVIVTVQNKSLVSLSISGGSSVQLQGTNDLVATGTFSDASTEDLTDVALWSSSNTSVLTVSNSVPTTGRVTGIAGGTSAVTATVGAVTDNVNVTVDSVTLTSIAVTPYDSLVASNGLYELQAIGTYSDASTSNITDLVTWDSSNTSAATISNTAGSKGVATTPSFAGYRTTNITATLGAVSGTTPFGVNGASISSIIVTPTISLQANESYQLASYANLSDGGVINLTQFSIWNSSNVNNVSVSNSSGSKGVVTGVQNGSSVIRSVFSGVSGTTTVTVSGSSTVAETGVGLLGKYYTWTGTPPPAGPFVDVNKKGERIDQRINFAWGAGNAPMGVGNQFAVRWTGFYKATSATNYFCTYSDDGVRVWINGVLVINNWTEHGPTWDCSANQALTVGTKYSVVIEYYENGGGSEAHFTRSSVSAVDAQNTSTRIIPQADLYPQ